jgi:hypothetical protein
MQYPFPNKGISLDNFSVKKPNIPLKYDVREQKFGDFP